MSASKGPKKQKAGASSEREGFSDDWQVVQAAKAAGKAHVEEMHSDDSDAEALEAAAKQGKGVPVTAAKQTAPAKKEGTAAPKAGAAPPKAGGAPKPAAKVKGVPLTPVQRKAMMRANKNPHTGKDKAVEVEEELIDEEAEEAAAHGSGSDAPDSDESDSDGEADWEKDAVKPAPVRKVAKAAPASASRSSRLPSLRTLLLWLAIAAVVVGFVWLRLQDSSLLSGMDAEDLSQPPSEQDDYYTVLQLDRSADLKAVKASYRKQVLLTHPDKNPDCTDCVMRFQRVQKAYDVLSNAEKRAMYDAVEISYDVLASETVELTATNFASEVTQSDDVWVIQLYTDWHRAAISFSTVWEEAHQRYGALLKFGRVHAFREKELARTLPVKFGMLPGVVVYANGQFSGSKTFLNSRGALAKLAQFMAQQYPNTVESVSNKVRPIRDWMKGATEDQASVLFVPDFTKNAAAAQKRSPPQQGSQQQRMLASQAEINEPSLTLKAVARKYQYAVRFAQVNQLGDVNSWRSWLKNVSAAFQLKPPSQLPAILYTEAGETAPKWLTGDLNKDKPLKTMDGIHRRMTPWFNSHSYARHCVDTTSKDPTICVLALACQPLPSADLEFHSFSSGARAMLKTAAFKNAPLQFAKVDVAKQTDMAPLCAALPPSVQASKQMSIVAIRGAELSVFGAEQHQSGNQQFDSWLQHVVKRDGKVQSLPAPLIPVEHIPDDVLPLTLPHFGRVLVPLKSLYTAAILVGLWLFAPLIMAHFTKFIFVVFMLSMLIPGFELVKGAFDKYQQL